VRWWSQELGRGVIFHGQCRKYHRSEVSVAAGGWQRGLVLVAVLANIRVGDYVGLVYFLRKICLTYAVEMSIVLRNFFCIVT